MSSWVTEDKFTAPCRGTGAGDGRCGSAHSGQEHVVDEADGTDAGRDDPLFGTLPGEFTAYLGHKEAVARLPDGAVLLASTDTCPVHAFRIGRNVYATQFHPELDAVALCDRVDAYSAHGYYEPHEQESLKAAAHEAMVTEPVRLLGRFVELHARP